MEILTFDEILEMSGSDYSIVLDLVYQQMNKSVTKPNKPFLPPKHTASDALKYADELKTYETELLVYNSDKKELQEKINDLNNKLESFLCEEFLTNIKENHKPAVYRYCRNNSDFHNLHNKLSEFNDIFE